MRTFTSVEELKSAEGQELGTSDWLTITQEAVNQFADATGDHQWIHVDPPRGRSGRPSPTGS
jgi:acyl dehydratase